jgi:signal transduction histidine kinase
MRRIDGHLAVPVYRRGMGPLIDGTLRPGPVALREVALRFLRHFGLVCAGWAGLLAATAPSVERPALLWAVVAGTAGWAVVSLAVGPWWWWGAGWLVVAIALELAGPAAGTDGWSVVGGATFLVIAAAAVSGRRRVVVAVVAVLSAAAMARPALSPGWNVGGGISTLLIFVLGATALTWLMRTLTATAAEHERLTAELAAADRDRAVTAERAEAAARLHDSVLQTLAQLERSARDDREVARLAASASADLRSFLREDRNQGLTLLAAVEEAVRRGAGDDRGRVRFVPVGADVPCDERLGMLVDAVGEAVRNAVTHTDGPVRVTAETDGADGATVWISDRGPGVDPESLPEDRLGVRESIIGRVERAGGTATAARTPGGFEWELRLPADASASTGTRDP